MAYVSLYRKYRPQTFAEIVGQDHVTRSLVNALSEDRLHHAYLFTGPRGTGKTSTARILAKSVNCVNGPTPTPCNACEQCVAITDGTSVDVIELDMASHGGVDDARELRDRARFSPASARRKVYILDEVHMASTAAFNALLKLIEEPPAHVLFAMATTDPQKVLPTIMSRVQRLDLRRVGAIDVARRVASLVEREGGTIDQAALDAVVRAGDGSLRDTESVLEQVLSYAEAGNITGADVEEVLGQTPFESTARLVDAMVAGDLAAGFSTVQELLDRGTDLRVFATDLVRHVRDLLVLVVAPGRPDLVDATTERRDALVAQADGLSADVLTMVLDELAAALDAMRKGEGARLAVELAVAKAVAAVTATGAAMPRLPDVSATPVARGAEIAEKAPTATLGGAREDPDPRSDDHVPTLDEAARDDEAAGAAAGEGDTAGEDTAPGDATGAGDEGDGEDGATADDDVPSDESVGPDEDVGGDRADGDAETLVDAADGEDGAEEAGGDEARADEDDGGDGRIAAAEDGEADGGVAATSGNPGADLAARAAARGAQVAREGMPTPGTVRPDGPSVERDVAPDPDEVAQLERIQSRWSAVLELVRADSVRGEAMLAKARPTRLRRRVLLLSYPSTHSFHAGQIASKEFDDVLVPAIERTCDVQVRIDVEVDGAVVGGGHPKPDEPAGSSSPAHRAAARATGSSATDSDATATSAGQSDTADEGRTPQEVLDPPAARSDHDPDGAATPVGHNPMADLDPTEAMDRVAAALADHLGATEVDPDVFH